MDLGSPTNVKNLINPLTMLGAFMFLNGIASGNLVDIHITVNKYWFPLLVLGRGPTQFTITLLKGSSITGIGTNGATWGVWFGFPVI